MDKDFRIIERVNFQFRFEIFNLFNRANYANMDTNIPDGSFAPPPDRMKRDSGRSAAF